jgi:hypothetical protein
MIAYLNFSILIQIEANLLNNERYDTVLTITPVIYPSSLPCPPRPVRRAMLTL